MECCRSKQYVDAALYLQDEVAAGRVKHVAMTNFGVEPMEKVRLFPVHPVVNLVGRERFVPRATPAPLVSVLATYPSDPFSTAIQKPRARQPPW
jgi:hypothetical protein